MSNDTLTITRIFDAPRELVFECWAKPEHMNQWSCPNDFEITFSEGEFIKGSTYRSCMTHAEYGDNIVGGKYLEITPPEKIVFTHAWEQGGGGLGNETTCTVELVDRDGKCEMTFIQTGFLTIEDRDGHTDGWGQCFTKLDTYIEGLQ